MKQTNFFKKTLLLAALLAGVSTAWATGADPYSGTNASNKAPIPGTIALDYGTYTGYNTSKTENPISAGHTDWMQANSTATFNLTNSAAKKYVFIIEAVTANSDASLEVKIYSSGKEASPESGTKSISIPNNGSNWGRYDSYCFLTEKDLPATDLTLKITFVNAGSNIQNIKIMAADSYPSFPAAGTIADEGTHIDLSNGKYYKSQYNGDKVISGLDNGGYMDNIFLNNATAGHYNLLLNVKDWKASGTLTATIYDMATGTAEVTTGSTSITENGDKEIAFTGAISPGLKRMRFDFTGTPSGGTIFNYQKVTTAITKYSLNEAWNYTPVNAASKNIELTRSISANSWSTLCLPFTISAADLGSALGTTVTLAQYDSYDSGTNALTFTAESGDQTVTANTPCMIKVTSDVSGAKTINGVTIVSGDNYVTKSGMTFQGVYNSTKMPDGAFFVSGNNLYTATASTKNIKPFRGYFTTDAGTAKAPMLNIIEENGETTAIYAVNADGTLEPIADGKVYNLNGQRVAQPTRGLYIVNGKKVIIK